MEYRIVERFEQRSFDEDTYRPVSIQLSVLLLVPVKHLNVLVGMLVELADATINILGDALMTCLQEGLPDRLSEEHILVGVLLKHPLQEERSP